MVITEIHLAQGAETRLESLGFRLPQACRLQPSRWSTNQAVDESTLW